MVGPRSRPKGLRTTNTAELIERLAGELRPVRPLASPWVRSAVWFAGSLAYLVIVIPVTFPLTDAAMKDVNSQFVVEQIAALTISYTAAVAALGVTIPGRSPRLALLTALPVAIWLWSLTGRFVLGSATEHDGPLFAVGWACIPSFILASIGPAAALVLMIRRGAPLMPKTAMTLGGVAAAGIGSLGERLLHPADAGLTALVWEMSCVVLLVFAAWLVSKRLFNWSS